MKRFSLQVYQPLFFVVFILISYAGAWGLSGVPVFKMPEEITDADYLEGHIIFKMKEETAPFLKSDEIQLERFQDFLKETGARDVKKMFPSHTPPAQKTHSSGLNYVDLSRIYYLTIPEDESLETAINRLYFTGLVEYAQPWYIPQLLYEPNDPFIGSQYYLNNIRAFDAWAIEQGDTNMVIAIIDTGIDLYHPDLIDDIAYNWDDPINESDDDNDGYIDNFYGWDFGLNDNYPQWDVNAHGVHVAGIAGAGTNNGTGMAGVGFKSRVLPIKISDADGRLVRAYEGIVYAADQGAQVINCSWGGPLSPGQFGQDIINYAVLNQDAVVVAAAGNSNNQVRIFPASFVNAISVAASDINDHKWGGSSFGKLVDITAPGANIFSTWPNGSYISSSGTSMAAPVVSGAAALLRSRYPHYNALQIAAKLKVTTDNIDTIAANQQYAGLLGTGRLNMYRALSENHHPYLMFVRLEHDMEHYQTFSPGETFEVGAEFINLLSTANNISAVLSTQSPHVEIISHQSHLGTVQSMATVNNFQNPFTIRIKETIPPSQEVMFTVEFLAGGNVFAGRESFSMTFNLDYLHLETRQLKTTVNSRGNIGFNFPDFNQGVGFLYANANQNQTMIKCAGVIAGVSTSRVSDNIYGAVENSFTQSFYSLENARFADTPQLGDMEITGSFDDRNGGNFMVGLKMDYTIIAFEEAPLDKFIIMEYKMINESGENLPGFYAGYFADWIIQDVRNHRAAWDPEHQMGYAFSANGGNFTGLQLLNHTNVRHYAFDNQGFGGSLRINNGFTSFEKYTALKSNRESAGFFDKDNDISTLISAGPFNLLDGDTLTVAFALLAGDHLNDLQASAQLAYLIYHGEYTSTEELTGLNPLELTAFPNPANDFITTKFYSPAAGETRISVYDMKARNVYSASFNAHDQGITSYTIDTASWPSGSYILQVSSGNTTQSLKVLKK